MRKKQENEKNFQVLIFREKEGRILARTFIKRLVFCKKICYDRIKERCSMKISEVKKQTTFLVKDTPFERIRISVYLVSRRSFNDERLIESQEIPLVELQDKPIAFRDVYLGKKAGNKTKVAFVCMEGKTLYFLEDNGEKVTVKKRTDFPYTYTDDYNEGYLISAHIW